MTDVRTAVALKEDAPKPPTLGEFVKTTITRQARDLSAVLPEHLDTERYSALVLTAVKANDRLMHAFRTEQGQLSVLLSVMQAAALGLEPNTPMQECWLQPRRNKDVDECELSIGYKGYAKLARRSGNVRELVAGVVREGDEFDYSRGLEKDTFHHKQLTDEGDELTHAYCIARLTNGGTAFTVMTRKQVEKRRAMSESWKNERARAYSPWTKWTEEQWRKTAIRNLLLHGEVDLSPELVQAATSDETPLSVTGGVVQAVARDAMAELESPPAPPGAATEDGDRQEPASSHLEGEGEPADAGSNPGEGAPPVPDGTVDPTVWTAKEWRDQIPKHGKTISATLKKAHEISKAERDIDGPGTIDDLADRPDIALAVAEWMGVK